MKNKLRQFLRLKYFQPFWEQLFNWSKLFMNYWGGAHIQNSGEIFILDTILKSVKNDNVNIFDVGVNNGEYIDYFIKLNNNNTREIKLYGFEPNANLFSKVNNKYLQYKNIVLSELGLGEKTCNTTLYIPTNNDMLSSGFKSHLLNQATTIIEKNIQIETVDNFCKIKNIREILLLKVDVEGYELNVLKGASSFIEDDRISYIQFEFGESMVDARVFFKDFWDILNEKYYLYRILPNALRPIPFYSEGLEVFHCANYLAVHKLIKSAF
ncbi:MAG: FkbM family methyltransferase [Saprospiraceae bacterium]|nr:FkbM family methyltransferase [Saprospiraceae bacterium]